MKKSHLSIKKLQQIIKVHINKMENVQHIDRKEAEERAKIKNKTLQSLKKGGKG